MKLKSGQLRTKVIEESLSFMVEVRDKEGRILQRMAGPAHSYVEQWNKIVCLMTRVGNLSVKDTVGTDWGGYATTRSLKATAAIADVTNGIRVGKGTTPVAIDDYVMETPSAEGSGVDQFEHQAMEFTAPVVAGSDCSFIAKRAMLNNSGATITGIREIGCYIGFTASASGKIALGFRDVLGSALTIPDGGALTVTYRLRVTV